MYITADMNCHKLNINLRDAVNVHSSCRLKSNQLVVNVHFTGVLFLVFIFILFFCLNRGYPLGQLCHSCAPGCASCEMNATHCLSCEEPFLFHNHQCVEECPPTHTVQDGECRTGCSVTCRECNPAGQCTGTEAQHGQTLTFISVTNNS